MSIEYELKCPLCEASNTAILFSVKEYKYIKCNECQVVFLYPKPETDTLNIIDTEDRTLYESNKNGAIDRIFRIVSESRAGTIEKFMKNKKGKALDIGCGIGTFLVDMEKGGWDIYGIELNEWAFTEAQKRIGKDRIFSKRLEDINFPNKNFDLVTLWHVLEHIEDPNSLIKEIKRILKEGSLLVIEVPNYDSFSLQLFKKDYFLHRIPGHLYYWSRIALIDFLEHSNFQILYAGCPFMMPLTFTKSFLSRTFAKNSLFYHRHPFIKNIINTSLLIILALPSIFIFIISRRFNKGETLRIIAKKTE